MISVVLINFNEATLLNRCLNSIKKFASEIVVIDLGSTDHSKDVYKEFNVKVVKHDWVPYADPIRNFAINQAKGEWILMLDPDEQVPLSLQNKLQEIINISKQKNVTVVNIPFKNIFFGSWISHTNFWPDKHLRFFKKGAVEWLDRVHAYPVINKGNFVDLPAKVEYAVIHESYKTKMQFIRKQTKYAKIESKNRRESGESFSLKRLIWLPIREFLARFIKHKGYLDGINGIFIVLVLMFYHIQVEWYLLFGDKNEIS